MKQFLLGICFGFLFLGCAAAQFSYPYYGLSAARYEGRLLAVDPKNDKDLSICEPDAHQKGKCIVMLGSEFYALKQDYIDIQNKLIACQRGIK